MLKYLSPSKRNGKTVACIRLLQRFIKSSINIFNMKYNRNFWTNITLDKSKTKMVLYNARLCCLFLGKL